MNYSWHDPIKSLSLVQVLNEQNLSLNFDSAYSPTYAHYYEDTRQIPLQKVCRLDKVDINNIQFKAKDKYLAGILAG